MKSAREITDDLVGDGYALQIVRKHMQDYNWEWDGYGVPTVRDMETTIEELVQDLLDNPENEYVSTGGFEVKRFKNSFELNFQIINKFADV